MKKNYLIAAGIMLAALVTSGWQANAQTEHVLDFKPGPNDICFPSQDVNIVTTYGCVPTGWQTDGESQNWLGATELGMMNWTIYAGGCGYVTYKTLVQFEELNALPPGAVIDYAELRMYGPPSSAMAPQGNSWYPPSNPAPYLKNDGTVKRITSSWSAGIVTWNTAPSNTTSNDEPIPVTSTQWSNNFAIPVTAMTNDMLTYGNNGYWLELNYAYTDIYRSTLFASSYNSNSSLWPELYLKYHLTCDASYGYCSNTNTPNTYSFTANDGTYPYTYTWNFGDGSPTVTGTSVNHTYTSTGSYQVCLTLSQQNQPICEFCEDICVNQIVACPAQRHSKQASTGVISAPIDKVKMDGTISIVSVSPNPTSSNLDVNFKLISESNVSYKVYDMSGKQVLSGNAAMGVGAQKISLSVEKLVPGTYLLEMNDSYTTTNTKFTKE